ncbi:hypothetical protein ISU10_19150 [Nocardioides agariphilus]|uniref:Uncharacterized protein n=1 Tax=Nocardioides agariphilus TaxID=433664 RepID=A0A930VLV8_9ACTN|nr:hypothetical protein [Nocardioides agariphilus]MBF4769894.1 hypothetical protein [Nocardioides agariphilus]
MEGFSVLARLVAATVVAAALTGCAPGTPDEDSWRGDATRAVGDVASAVQTARIALEASQQDHLHHAYLQAVLVDAERTGGLAADALSSVQPPDIERRRSSDVDDQLEQATGLLQEARIAVVAHDTGEYADLVDRLERTASSLQQLETDLEAPPGDAR